MDMKTQKHRSIYLCTYLKEFEWKCLSNKGIISIHATEVRSGKESTKAFDNDDSTTLVNTSHNTLKAGISSLELKQTLPSPDL